jgi:hypothetical protein
LEGYDPGRGSLTAMPEATTWTLMLAAFGALGAVGYATQRRAAAPQDREPRQNFLSLRDAHNPLKRLVSDERIQGNPSFSNSVFLAFQGLKPRVQGFPNL